VALHHHINTKRKLENYLAARQVGVVLTVFLISEVTRTPGLAVLPGTTIAIPTAFDILFRMGVPGALLVLVVGQVLPQIVVARRPAALMNLPPMVAGFHATRLVGLLGLAEPARWLAARATRTERIPSAPRQRYADTTRDAMGWGVLTQSSTVRVEEAATVVQTTATVAVYDAGLPSLAVDLASLDASPDHVRVAATVTRGDQVLPVSCSGIQEDRVGVGRPGRLWSAFSPLIGFFQAGDILTVGATLRFEQQLFGQASLTLATPVKLALLRVILVSPRYPLPPARSTVNRPGELSAERCGFVQPHPQPDGSVVFMIVESYPDAGSEVSLSWHDAPVQHVGLDSGPHLPWAKEG
jgi:hypothetical protein